MMRYQILRLANELGQLLSVVHVPDTKAATIMHHFEQAIRLPNFNVLTHTTEHVSTSV